jgi:hypothetical protein
MASSSYLSKTAVATDDTDNNNNKYCNVNDKISAKYFCDICNGSSYEIFTSTG